jgi:undecaprenyl-diphosphatase
VIDLWQAVVLGTLQGATEFLPVSSSGHLVIVPELLGWPASGLHYDVAVHWATALAVLLYFREDWRRLVLGSTRSRSALRSPEARLLGLIGVATIPAAVVGYFAQEPLESALITDPRGAARVAASMLMVTGLAMLGAELVARRLAAARRAEEASAPGSVFIGFAQAAALVPGISRSGATMAAGMVTGLRRDEAARFSFLLATPVILGAGLLQMTDFARGGPTSEEVLTIAAGAAAAFTAGYAVIYWLMRYLRSAPLYPFVAYTWVMGAFTLWWLR